MKHWSEVRARSGLNEARVQAMMEKILKGVEGLEFSRLLSEHGVVETLLNFPESGRTTYASPTWDKAKSKDITTF